MSLMDDILALDAAAFTDPDGMPGAETVVYTPLGGSPRTITVNVDRQPPERLGDEGRVYRPMMEIDVANSATTGISATELNTGGDSITIAYPKGGTVEAHRIIGAIITQDAGMIRLELA